MRAIVLFLAGLGLTLLTGHIQGEPTKKLSSKDRAYLESYLTISYDYNIYFTFSPDDFVQPLSSKEIKRFQQKLKQQPRDVNLLLKVSKILSKQGQDIKSDQLLTRAEEILKEKLKANEGEKENWLLLCQVEAALGRGKEVIASCERAAQLLPKNGKPAITIAYHSLGNQNFSQAIVWAERAIKADPANLSFRGLLYFLRFFSYLFQGGYAELEKEGFPVKGIAQRFKMSEEEKVLLSGEDDLAVVWAVVPKTLIILLRFKWINRQINPARNPFRFLSEKRVIAELEKSKGWLSKLQRNPNIATAILGILSMVQGEKEEARQLLYQALEGEKDDPQYYEYLLFFHSVFREYEKARILLQRKIKRLSKSNRDFVFLAKIDALEGDWQRAEQELKSLLKDSPHDPSGRYGMAMVYMHQKKWAAAEKILHSLEVREHGQDVYFPLGIMELLKGNRKEAKVYLKKSLALKKNEKSLVILNRFY